MTGGPESEPKSLTQSLLIYPTRREPFLTRDPLVVTSSLTYLRPDTPLTKSYRLFHCIVSELPPSRGPTLPCLCTRLGDLSLSLAPPLFASSTSPTSSRPLCQASSSFLRSSVSLPGGPVARVSVRFHLRAPEPYG